MFWAFGAFGCTDNLVKMRIDEEMGTSSKRVETLRHKIPSFRKKQVEVATHTKRLTYKLYHGIVHSCMQYHNVLQTRDEKPTYVHDVRYLSSFVFVYQEIYLLTVYVLEYGGSLVVVVVGKLKVFDLAFVVVDFVEAVSVGGLEFNKINKHNKYVFYGAKLPIYFTRSFRQRFE